MDHSNQGDRPILLFDGVCNLCNVFVDFILRYEIDSRFLFASLQSDKGRELTEKYHLSKDIDSVIVIKSGAAYSHADAVFQVLDVLPWYFKIIKVFKIIPNKLLIAGYKLIAKNRYRFFGKRETCRLPKKEERVRFLG